MFLRFEDWFPVFMIVYNRLEELGYKPVGIGAVAFSLLMRPESTKDVDIALERETPIEELARIGRLVEGVLSMRNYRARFSGIVQGSGTEDWILQAYVVLSKGKILGIEVFTRVSAIPVTFYALNEVERNGLVVRVLSLESWFASKLIDPNGIDERNLRRMERATGRIRREALFEVLRKLKVRKRDVFLANVEDLIRRTQNQELRDLLTFFIDNGGYRERGRGRGIYQ